MTTPAVTTPRIVVLDDYQSAAESRADWASLDAEVEFVTSYLEGADELVTRLAGVTAVVAMRERTAFPREVLERLPDLRLLVTTGMRNVAIDTAAARELGITVCGTRGHLPATAELAWALILGLARDVAGEHKRVSGTDGQQGGWQQTVGVDLAGHTLGIVGLGRLGSRVAAVGRAFDMNVIAWSPNLTAERAEAGGARLVTKEELFRSSRFVSLHMVLAEGTRGVVGEAELGLMRPDAFLVNTARAGLVDQEALRRVIEQRSLAGVGLDVYEREPLPADDWLRSAPGVLLSPHMGYVTDDTYRTFFADAVDDIRAFFAGTPLRELE